MADSRRNLAGRYSSSQQREAYGIRPIPGARDRSIHSRDAARHPHPWPRRESSLHPNHLADEWSFGFLSFASPTMNIDSPSSAPRTIMLYRDGTYQDQAKCSNL